MTAHEIRSLRGSVAVVTGASRGIGREVALSLGKVGSRVCLVARGEAGLRSVAAAMTSRGTETVAVAADLGKDEDICRLTATVKDRFGRLDVLVHSAGVIRMGPLETAPVKDLDEQLRLNVRAPYYLTQLMLPLIKASKGQVVFVNSSAGLNAGSQWGAYSASKAALKMIADSLRDEVNPDGIRVLSIYPGKTATSMQETIHNLQGRSYNEDQCIQPETIAASILHALMLPPSAELTALMVRPMAKP